MAKKPGDARKILDDLGIEGVCALVMEGKLYREICREIGVASHSTLIAWLAEDAERGRLMEEARRFAAYSFDEMALEQFDGVENAVDLGVAREKASHLRWRAKAFNPRYGDKVALTGEGGGAIKVERIELVAMTKDGNSPD